MSDWQKGYKLEYLKSFGDLFKQRHKSLVHGAFGLVKERDIAEALARKRIIWTGKPPQAAALFTLTQRPSEQHDFAQRQFVIRPGTVLVKAFAANTIDAGNTLLSTLRQRSLSPIVIEAFEEDLVARDCLKACGYVWQTSKISAGSEIKGIYSSENLGLAPLETYDRATLTILKHNFLSAEEHATILEEMEFANFAQHYSDYNKRHSWTAFAIRGYQNDPTFIIKPAEMSKGWKEENAALLANEVRWTSAAKRFPTTRKVAERLGASLDRVRFMRLRSKDGELARHADITDREAGTADGFVTRLHIPIRTSKAVTFYGWDCRGQRLTVNAPERCLLYLDQRKPHAVKNTDPTLDRIHLVVDCFADLAVRRLISRAMESPKKAA